MKCLVCGKQMPLQCTCSDMGSRLQKVRDAKDIASTEAAFKDFSKRMLGVDVDSKENTM